MFFSNKKKIKKRRENLCKEAEIFIQVHFVRERNSERYKYNTLSLKSDPERDKVIEWYESHDNPETYSEIVSALLNDSGKDAKNISDKILLDKDYFEKLKANTAYIPSKGEVITICFAFHLTYEASRALLKSAEYSLTNSDKEDLIVRYFLENKNYSINDLNFVLSKLCETKVKDIK